MDAVADPGQRAADTLEVARREVEQHQPAGLQVSLGEPLLDRLLALDEPVHGRVQRILVGVGHTELVGKRGVGPRPRHAELARFRRKNALRDHRDDEGALARGLGIDELLEAQSAHGRQHRIDVAVGARHHLQAVLDGPQLLALQDAPDRLDLVEWQRRQVGQRPFPDALALAHALPQQIGRPRVAVGDGVDVHDAHKP
jgi:hypothetical protein